MQDPGGLGGGEGPSEEEEGAPSLCSGTIRLRSRFHLGMGGRGGAPRVAARQENPLRPEPAGKRPARRVPHRTSGSEHRDPARPLSPLHTSFPALPAEIWSLGFATRKQPLRQRAESSGLFKSTLNIHGSKNK